jgi:nitroreductase
MKRRTFVKNAVVALPAIGAAGALAFGKAGEFAPIKLPKPGIVAAVSLGKALKNRRTTRAISAEPLPLPTLGDLLWAACGVNRPGAGLMGKPGRTAPSASNSQEIDLYVALPRGVYLYEAGPHRLAPVVAGDLRGLAGYGDAGKAPVNIFYVVDLTRFVVGPGQPDPSIGDPEVQKSYYFTDTGFIAQNVYLFAAAQGLAAWFHNCDKVRTAREFKLRPAQRVLFAQTVGHPGKD